MVVVRRQASEAKGPFPGGKRVGSWGKKERKKQKGVGRTPADLHPPLNKTGLVLEVKQIKEDTVVYLLIDYLKSPIGLSGLWMRQGEQA